MDDGKYNPEELEGLRWVERAKNEQQLMADVTDQRRGTIPRRTPPAAQSIPDVEPRVLHVEHFTVKNLLVEQEQEIGRFPVFYDSQIANVGVARIGAQKTDMDSSPFFELHLKFGRSEHWSRFASYDDDGGLGLRHNVLRHPEDEPFERFHIPANRVVELSIKNPEQNGKLVVIDELQVYVVMMVSYAGV